MLVLGLFTAYNNCSKNPVSGNNNPTITSIIAEKSFVNMGETITIRAIFVDIDGDKCTTKLLQLDLPKK